jgi:putative SOS response-associated peptidase YedK
MCGRFTNQVSWPAYHEQLQGFLDEMHQGWKAPADDPKPRYNLAPTQNAPIIIADGDSGLDGVMARWDLVPWSTKDRWRQRNGPASMRASRQSPSQAPCAVQ